MAATQLSANPTHWQSPEVKVIDGQPVRFSDVCVHEFVVHCDDDQAAIMAGEPLWQWQQSEAGQWVMQHAEQKPYWHMHTDFVSYGTRFQIMARLSEHNRTFFTLKFGQT